MIVFLVEIKNDSLFDHSRDFILTKDSADSQYVKLQLSV